MKILFIFPRPTAYNSQTVRELPSGGTEKATIFLGEAFQKLGHEVQWITTLEGLVHPHPTPDVVITQHAEFLEHYPDSLKIFWSHHFADQPLTQQQAPFVRCFANKIVTLSSCHSADLKTLLKLDSVTIGHGVWLGELAQGEKDPYRLIYASTPFRGLERIPALFKAIKEAEPRATIAIASSMRTYGEQESDQQYQPLFDELAQIPGVELLGSLNQEQLYREYAKASIFFYPCIWRETYCLAMDEAIAHGCTPIISVPIGRDSMTERTLTSGSEREITAWSIQEMTRQNHPRIWKQPKDWLEVARQWEREVLSV